MTKREQRQILADIMTVAAVATQLATRSRHDRKLIFDRMASLADEMGARK